MKTMKFSHIGNKKKMKMNPSNESDSIDLFDFGSPCVVVSHEQRLERLRQKKASRLRRELTWLSDNFRSS